jgi:hypothetical protein
MSEKGLISVAEIIESNLPVRRPHEAVLGAFAVADGKELTFSAMLRQGITLVLPELLLPG